MAKKIMEAKNIINTLNQKDREVLLMSILTGTASDKTIFMAQALVGVIEDKDIIPAQTDEELYNECDSFFQTLEEECRNTARFMTPAINFMRNKTIRDKSRHGYHLGSRNTGHVQDDRFALADKKSKDIKRDNLSRISDIYDNHIIMTLDEAKIEVMNMFDNRIDLDVNGYVIDDLDTEDKINRWAESAKSIINDLMKEVWLWIDNMFIEEGPQFIKVLGESIQHDLMNDVEWKVFVLKMEVLRKEKENLERQLKNIKDKMKKMWDEIETYGFI